MQHVKDWHCLDSCNVCKAYNDGDSVDDLLRHVQDHLVCQLCPNTFPDDRQLHRHIEKRHVYGPYRTDEGHSWVQCPFAGCHCVKAGKLWHHVYREHSFVRCSACPNTEVELSEAAKHLEEHTSLTCPECDGFFIPAALEQHLVEDHAWMQCPYCVRAAVDDNDFQEHLGSHQLRDCSVCSEKQPWDQMKQHLTRAHCWLLRSFCSEAVQEADIFDHMQEAHRQCPKCDHRGNLADHLERSHAGTKCPTCGDLLPGDDLGRHMDAKHPRTKCALCPWDGLLSKFPEHIRGHASGGHAGKEADGRRAATQQATGGHAGRTKKTPRVLDREKCNRCRDAKVKVGDYGFT